MTLKTLEKMTLEKKYFYQWFGFSIPVMILLFQALTTKKVSKFKWYSYVSYMYFTIIFFTSHKFEIIVLVDLKYYSNTFFTDLNFFFSRLLKTITI